MLALLGMFPVIGQIVQAVTAAWFNAKVSIATAQIGGDRDVAVASVKAQAVGLQAIASSKILSWLVVIFALPIACFEWKVVVYDTMLGLGSTPAIRGEVADWMNTIIYCLFGGAALHTYFSRKGG